VRVRLGKKEIPILMYHSISRSSNPKFRQLAVPPESFAEQMAYLYQHTYSSLNVTQLVHILSQEQPTLPKRPVVLTFDDGFADYFTSAFPVLRQISYQRQRTPPDRISIGSGRFLTSRNNHCWTHRSIYWLFGSNTILHLAQFKVGKTLVTKGI
jgi:hypothetical protein